MTPEWFDVDADRFVAIRRVIGESAIAALETVKVTPLNPTKGSPMKKITDLTSDQVGRIAALYRVRGATRATVGQVAKTWQITESDAKALGTAATTLVKPTTTRTITESGDISGPTVAPLSATDARNAYLADNLARQVNAAEARVEADGGSMAGLSTQALEALAAARFA
jgi:hypothetical protein